MKWIALAFVVLYVGALVIGKIADALFDYFQVDGNRSTGVRQLPKGCTHTAGRNSAAATSNPVGGPFAVDASNGPNLDPFALPNVEPLNEANRAELLRLAALVELHRFKIGDPIVMPPPSRAIRRSIH